MLNRASEIIKSLQSAGLDPMLYGSLGAALYLGDFKEFGDIDLLVNKQWLAEQWPELVEIMNNHGFQLTNEREHEFTDTAGLSVAFASDDILVRDGIIESLSSIGRKSVSGVSCRALSPGQLKKAYEFSVKDGYREDVRGKQDNTLIKLLDDYISATT